MRGFHPDLPVSGVEESHNRFTSHYHATLDTSARCAVSPERPITARTPPWPSHDYIRFGSFGSFGEWLIDHSSYQT